MRPRSVGPFVTGCHTQLSDGPPGLRPDVIPSCGYIETLFCYPSLYQRAPVGYCQQGSVIKRCCIWISVTLTPCSVFFFSFLQTRKIFCISLIILGLIFAVTLNKLVVILGGLLWSASCTCHNVPGPVISGTCADTDNGDQRAIRNRVTWFPVYPVFLRRRFLWLTVGNTFRREKKF